MGDANKIATTLPVSTEVVVKREAVEKALKKTKKEVREGVLAEFDLRDLLKDAQLTKNEYDVDDDKFLDVSSESEWANYKLLQKIVKNELSKQKGSLKVITCKENFRGEPISNCAFLWKKAAQTVRDKLIPVLEKAAADEDDPATLPATGPSK